MRKTFAQILKDAQIDISREYIKLYDLFFSKTISEGYSKASIRDVINDNYINFDDRGTCLDLDDFDETYGFDFETIPNNITVDDFVLFCEYLYNLMKKYNNSRLSVRYSIAKLIEQQIESLIEVIGYMITLDDKCVIFVPKDNVVISVAGTLPSELSYKLISYNHHSSKGNLDVKKEILLKLAYQIEANEKILSSIDNTFKKDLYFLFNNLGIRHNNTDPNAVDYKEFVGTMNTEALEYWYDETYQMSLLALMRIEHFERSRNIKDLKDKIGNK